MTKMKSITTKVYEVNGKTYATLAEAQDAQKAGEISMRLDVLRNLFADAIQTDLTLDVWLKSNSVTVMESLKAYKKAIVPKVVRVAKPKKVKA